MLLKAAIAAVCLMVVFAYSFFVSMQYVRNEDDEKINDWFMEYNGKRLTKVMMALDPLRNHDVGPSLIKAGGYWLPARVPFIFPTIQDMEFRSHDVVACAFPKSGTNWVHYILHLVMTECNPRTIQGHHPRLIEILPLTLDDSYGLFLKDKSPRLAISHLPAELLPIKTFNARVVYVYRNAKDVATSLYHHYLSLAALPDEYQYNKTFDDFARDFLNGEVVYGPHFKHIQSYWNLAKKGEKNLLFVKYENLMNDKPGQIRRIAEYLGKQLTMEQIDLIIDLTSAEKMRLNSEVNWSEKKAIGHFKKENDFIRKAIVGDWRTHFNNSQLLADFDYFVQKHYPPELFPHSIKNEL